MSTQQSTRPHRRAELPTVEFTPAARAVISAVCRRDGPQVVLLAWPAGVTYLPRGHYLPGTFDVVLGELAGCPVYTDTRRLALFQGDSVLLDSRPGAARRRHPPLSATVRHSSGADHGADSARGRYAAGSELCEELLDELAVQFSSAFSERHIAGHIRSAIEDLTGSVSEEALPEMAARLAHHRLWCEARAIESGPGPVAPGAGQ